MESERRIDVRMLASTIGSHELIFRMAAQSGVFHPATTARIIGIAEEYHRLRLAAAAEQKTGAPIPDSFKAIGSLEDWRAFRDIRSVSRMPDLFETGRIFPLVWFQKGFSCSVEWCDDTAVLLAVGMDGKPRLYCLEHARHEVHAVNPDAVVRCPNCGTIFAEESSA